MRQKRKICLRSGHSFWSIVADFFASAFEGGGEGEGEGGEDERDESSHVERGDLRIAQRD